MPATRKAPKPPPEPVEAEVEVEVPSQEKRVRSPKMKKLESAVEGIYIMLGGGLATLPEQIGGGRTRFVGLSLAGSCSEIAEAWIDLAEDDKRVLKAIESLTSFSGWGKVIGLHLMAIGAGVPGIAAVQQPQPAAHPMPAAGATGGDTDLQQMMALADFLRQAQTEQRAEPVQEQPTAADVQQAVQQQQEPVRGAVRRQPAVRPGRGAGIPSAADLGVTNADTPESFPTSGPENVGG